jgi:hypothetical protein
MPHLKELVKLHEDSPFAVVGVNTGDGPEAFRRGMKEHQLPWISAFQGKDAPIAELYRVRGFPTYFVLDADGRIVYKGHDGKAADRSVAQLLKQME